MPSPRTTETRSVVSPSLRSKNKYAIYLFSPMRLTLHTDYALRLLLRLAVEPEALHTIESIAARYAISRHHLTKVAQTLVQAGFVESVRGRHGGLRLARPAADIGLGDVVRATEDNFALVECFAPDAGSCVIAGSCGLQRVLREAIGAFFEVVDRHTLGDLVARPDDRRRLRRVFGAPLVHQETLPQETAR